MTVARKKIGLQQILVHFDDDLFAFTRTMLVDQMMSAGCTDVAIVVDSPSWMRDSDTDEDIPIHVITAAGMGTEESFRLLGVTW